MEREATATEATLESRDPASAPAVGDLSYQEAEAALRRLAGAASEAHLGPAEMVGRPANTTPPSTAQETGAHRVEARYRVLVEQIPAVTFMAALDEGVNEMYVSPQIEKMLGYSQREWLEDPILWYSRLHPDDRERWHLEFARTCATGEQFRSQYRFIARDGRVVWVHGEARMVHDENGRPLFLQGIAFDITQQKQAEEALRRSQSELEELVQRRTVDLSRAVQDLQTEMAERVRAEEARRDQEARLRSVVETAVDGIVVIDESGIVESLNLAAERIFGYTAAEVLGRNVSMLMPSPYLTEHDGYLARYVATGVRKVIGIGREVTGRRKDGAEFPIDLAISEMHLRGGRRFTGVVRDITARKRAEEEHRLLLTQRAQSQKLESIGHLAAGIAHEINTPIQYVGSNVTFLRDAFADFQRVLVEHQQLLSRAKAGTLDAKAISDVEAFAANADMDGLADEVPHAIDESLEGVSHVARIVQAMKEFSHPGSDFKVSENLNALIENTIMVASNEWKYVAEMVTDFDPSLPLVPCLAGEFKQVILNLIVNAVHAIGDRVKGHPYQKGVITIATRARTDDVEIRVQDTGTGIPETIRSKVFDPFFTTKPIGKGSGQGLAIARTTVVKKHEGTFDFETEMGKGTTFIIRLPIGGQQPANR